MSVSIVSPFLRRGAAPWTCRSCLQSQRRTLPQQRNTFASRAESATHTQSGYRNSKRRKRLLVVGGGVALGAAVVTLNEDAKHAWAAAQRTYRVAATLALNIKE